MPAEATPRPLSASDGTGLATSVRRGAGPGLDVGTVVLVHGIGEHAGRYAHVVDALRGAGWAVVAYDHRGHGRSGGRRGTIPRPDALLEDLAEVVDLALAETAPRRLLLLGHSMGGAVAARFVAEALAERPAPWSRPVDALVLSSPALANDLTWTDRVALALLGLLAPNLTLGNGLDAAKLSHDPAVGAAYLADPLTHDRVSPRLARFVLDAGAHALARAADWQVPTLLLWAGADALVAARGSAAFAAASPPSVVHARAFPALYHEVFNEAEPARTEVLAALRAWLDGVAAAVPERPDGPR
jgi:alpha-beta hydrolase superfamily lysophospholipase